MLRLALGQAYLQAQQFPEALAEFDAAQRRRGEAASVFLDDVPTYRFLAGLNEARAQASAGLR